MTDPKSLMRYATFALAGIAVFGVQKRAEAVSYASQVRNTSGTTWEYVLNQDASDVTILRDGGNALSLGAMAAGRYTFDLSTFSSFDIQVETTQAAGLARVSDINNAFTEFRRPSGLAINKNPSSEFFGTIYVANSIASADAGRNNRIVGDGIYALRPDLQGVDFSTPVWAVPAVDDDTQAKVGTGWSIVADGSNSPFRIALDEGGNIIAGDWSDVNGGIKFIGPDLTGGGLVLDFQSGNTYGSGAINPTIPLDGSQGSPFIHSAIRGVPNVSGTLGVDLVVSAMDQGLNRNPVGLLDGTFPVPVPDPQNPPPGFRSDGFPEDGNHVWRWNVGSDTSNSQVIPELIIDLGSNGNSPDELGTDSSGRPYLLALNIPVRGDAEFFPQLGTDGLWIVTQPRFDGNESGIVIVDVDETGATAPTVLWSSRQFTIDNNLDGYVGTDPGATLPTDPNNDVFRNTGSVDVSDDGETLYIHRWVTDDENFVDDDGNPNPDVNPYLGRDSNLPGALLAIPLDASGIPVINIDNNGTPGDTSDDLFTNLESIETTDQDAEFDNFSPPLNFPNLQENHEVEVDAAGNIYITDDISRLVEVFTPGGDRVTSFSFDGTSFAFDPDFTAAPCVPGDTDGDGDVDLVDLDTLGANFGVMGAAGGKSIGDFDGDGDVDLVDLDTLGANFGTGTSAAVPEPSAIALLLVASGLGLHVRRR